MVLHVSLWIQWHEVMAMGPMERTFSSLNLTPTEHMPPFPPTRQPGTWAPSARDPLRSHQHQLYACPLLQITMFYVSGMYLKHSLDLLLLRSDLHWRI